LTRGTLTNGVSQLYLKRT